MEPVDHIGDANGSNRVISLNGEFEDEINATIS